MFDDPDDDSDYYSLSDCDTDYYSDDDWPVWRRGDARV
jgi:hypothetical protein